MIPRLFVPAGRKPHIVQYLLNKRLHSIVRQRYSMFERVYSVTAVMANKLLDCGYKLLSRFGRWCPVAVRPFPTLCLKRFTYCFVNCKERWSE